MVSLLHPFVGRSATRARRVVSVAEGLGHWDERSLYTATPASPLAQHFWAPSGALSGKHRRLLALLKLASL